MRGGRFARSRTAVGVLAAGILVAGCSGDATERAAAGDASLVVLSYNVRYDNPDDAPNDWPSRRDRVASLIRFHGPDVAGLQEVLLGQLRDLEERLPGYAWIGAGRDDGAEAGEFSPIFYRTDRLRPVESGTFWLSTTPDSAGSVGWDAALPRVATWARFEDRATGRALLHVNTHFDHEGAEARRESARLLRARAESLADGLPIIVTGDLNAEPASPPLAALLACPGAGTPAAAGDPDPEGDAAAAGDAARAGAVGDDPCLVDARELATVRHGPAGTFSGFAVGGELDRRIDYVLASRGVEVLRHGHLSASEGGYHPSDHLPVLAELRLPR